MKQPWTGRRAQPQDVQQSISELSILQERVFDHDKGHILVSSTNVSTVVVSAIFVTTKQNDQNISSFKMIKEKITRTFWAKGFYLPAIYYDVAA